jgi:uncharacterized damage-inducible protein DinB
MKNDQTMRMLLANLDQAYNRQSWHGTNLRGSLRGLSPALAARRPKPGRHNIWEIVVHCAYWKYAVWRRLTGAKRNAFPLKGSNWFRRPLDASERAWRADLALLERMHRQLRETIASISARNLNRKSKGSRHTSAHQITGIAAHDLYHAGQIQLLKRLVQR